MKNFMKVAPAILALSLIPTALVWLPFLFRLENFLSIPLPQAGMQTIISNYDGALYIVIAKSLYNLEYIANNFPLTLPLEYYAAHFPLYPLLIRLLSYVVGNPWGMLIATQIGVIISDVFFYRLARKKISESESLWLTFIFTIFPARWLIVKSVGSPEPLFIGFILATIYYFSEKKYWKAAVWGVLAQLTKSPGVLLFITLTLYWAFENLTRLTSIKQSVRKWFLTLNFNAFPILLIPISLIGLFVAYYYQFGDFFAYFNSGDNIHLFFPPFQIFNYSQSWVQTHWLEDIIFIYLLSLLGLTKLVKNKEYLFAFFVGVFFTTIIFVSHRDVSRYALPIAPFILLSFTKELQSKEAKFIFIFLILPIYMFTLAFISNNTMQISDWTPFL